MYISSKRSRNHYINENCGTVAYYMSVRLLTVYIMVGYLSYYYLTKDIPMCILKI